MGKKGFGDMMKQVQKMQAKMEQLQDELNEREVEGSAGGGMVKAVVTGKGDIKEIKIEPQVMEDGDVEMLEDLIVAALSQAQENAAQLQQEVMSELTGGLNIPGLGGLGL
ncbi:MAG: YbaB/EbfC family nucleoid-associated protein [candidate division Zixibacteria bacterium]|nr:YbaB/EbfC family nucleoid-associated protein [candidate division Zixibacteria bacterium]